MKVFLNFPVNDKTLELAIKDLKILNITDSYREADAYLIETEIPPITSNLKLIQTITAGVNHLPFNIIPKNITICSNAGAYSDYVAEHAMALLLSFYKKIPEKNEEMRKGIFRPESVESLKGKKVTIIGYGGIGKAIARLAKAFKMKVNCYGRNPIMSDINCDRYSTVIDEVLGSDIYIIALPYTKFTKRFINEKLLQKMGHKFILVNIARAGIVDKEALLEYCQKNNDVYYLTDVWWNEPEISTIPWRNIIATPHIAGGISEQAFSEALLKALLNIEQFFKGSKQNVVDRSEYEGISDGAPALRKIVDRAK